MPGFLVALRLERRALHPVLSSTLLLLFLSATLGPAASADELPSYWGPIPAATDSLRFVPPSGERGAWEIPLHWTYDIARLPFRLFTLGAKRTVIYLDESNAFYHLERLLGDVALPYGFRVGGIVDQLSGAGLAVNFYHDALGGEGRRLQLKTQTSVEHNQRASLGYVFPLADDSEVGIGAGYRKRPNARFFGIGPGSEESSESYFLQELGWAGLEFRKPIAAQLSADLDLVYSSISARETDEVDLEKLDPAAFGAAAPVGFGESSQGFEISLGLTHDDTQESARPAEGGLRRLQAGWFQSSDAGGSHLSLRAEAQQFFRLWWDRTLALRCVGGYLDSEKGSPHFARMFTNTDPDQFRGYEDHRWRDQGLLLFNAEYRYPVWAYREREGTGIDGYLFADGGQVFSADDRPALRDFVYSFGGGFRFVGARGFGARAELARSEEEIVFRLSLDQIFQFPKNALYHGRPPIPLR